MFGVFRVLGGVVDSSRLQIGLIQLPRRTKRVLAIIADGVVMLAALACTLLLVHPQTPGVVFDRWPLFAVMITTAVLIFIQQGLYRESFDLLARGWYLQSCAVLLWWRWYWLSLVFGSVMIRPRPSFPRRSCSGRSHCLE